jgi:D-tyrosyl-tRNA(Tyr) deacylase
VISLVQRVASARVEVAGRIVGAIDRGLLVFVCVEPDDDEAIADRLAAKLVRLRVFADGAGKMNLDLGAVGGALLLVSQFTLAADTTAGNRPSFVGAGAPAAGRRLFERVVASARALQAPVACGEFGADMQVHLVNDGPVTLPIVVRR